MAIDFNKRSITVMGTVVEFDTRTGLPIADISPDMDQVAALMGYWASVWAAAEREKVMVDAHYRQWKAKAFEAKVAVDPKMGVDKIRGLLEADPKFIDFKEAIAKAEENVTLARGVFESFGKKANMLQSRGAMERRERDAQDMVTPDGSGERDIPVAAVQGGIQRMKDANKKKAPNTKGNEG